MQNIKKYFMTLALLLTAVTGAWAEDNFYLVVDGTSATLKYDGNKGTDDPYLSIGAFGNSWANAKTSQSTATTITVDATCKNFQGTSLSALFFNFTALTSINNLENLNMANVTNISGMFRQCSSLTAIDVSSFNTAQVTNMNFLFMGCTSLTTLDLSNFNTASVTTMNQMFDGCSLLENIYVGDGWSTAAVTTSNNMFRKCSKLPNFDANKVDKTNAHTGEGGYLKVKPVPTEWELKPDADKKVWTLAKMPAYDVELQVEYFAESNLFLGKEALADKANISVLNGSTAVTFDDAGKSTATVTEGNTVTAKFTGKKVLGMTVAKAAGNTYLKWDTDQKKLVKTDIPTEVTTVQNADAEVEWTAGTYVVEGDVTIGGTITLLGNVDLIIKDGAKLTVNNSYIYGYSSYNLSIFGQSNQTGELVVNCSNNDVFERINTLEIHSAKVKATASGDNCGGFKNIQKFNVYGGSVDAESTGTNGYGITLASSGSMKIYGGDVKALGKGNNKFGIRGSLTKVTVYGGKLWAGCADNKAIDASNVTLEKGDGFTGKIETSADNSAWTEYTEAGTPETKYVRVGY